MPPAPLKPLRRWIWRAFLQSALIPLVLVESVLIGVYLYTNESIRESQIGYLQNSALQDLDSAVRWAACALEVRADRRSAVCSRKKVRMVTKVSETRSTTEYQSTISRRSVVGRRILLTAPPPPAPAPCTPRRAR